MEILKPWKIKQIPSSEKLQNCSSPSTVAAVSFLRAPFMEQPELALKFLTLLEGLLICGVTNLVVILLLEMAVADCANSSHP